MPGIQQERLNSFKTQIKYKLKGMFQTTLVYRNRDHFMEELLRRLITIILVLFLQSIEQTNTGIWTCDVIGLNENARQNFYNQGENNMNKITTIEQLSEKARRDTFSKTHRMTFRKSC